MTTGVSSANAIRPIERSAVAPQKLERTRAQAAKTEAERPEATDRGTTGAKRVEEAVQASGGQPVGGPPTGAPAAGGGASRGSVAESSSSSSSAEVDARTRAELRSAATGGDRTAAREVARREAAELGEGPEKLQAIREGVDVWI